MSGFRKHGRDSLMSSNHFNAFSHISEKEDAKKNDNDISIRVNNLSKCYQVYQDPQDRLKQSIFPRFQRLMGVQPKKYFREFWALRDVSFEIKKGQTIAIIGRNGSGKSTLLQMICGTLTPTVGTIETGGRIAALLELGSGFNPEFNGRENVYINAAVLGLSKKEVDDRYDSIVAFADIGEFIEQPVKTYSSGMYVRLAFSVVIHTDPDVLVIDEALAVGDFLFQQKCIRFMRENLKQTTKLLVTHDMASVSNLADRALLLRQGQLIYEGRPKSVIEKFQIVSRLDEKNTLINNSKTESNQTGEQILNNSKDSLESFEWCNISSKSLSGTMRTRIQKYSWSIDCNTFQKNIQNECRLSIMVSISSEILINTPIIGYQVQNRFGTVIFGENTVSSGLLPDTIQVGISTVEIDLTWPEIETGQYSITIGIGSGDDSHQHVIECWAHNIFSLESIATVPIHGLFNQRVENVKINSIK